MQQQRLQALQHQQQARQALMAQHAAYQNMGGVSMGLPLAQMTPAAQAAHMAAIGRRMPVANPLHLQQTPLAQHQQGQPMNVRDYLGCIATPTLRRIAA